VIDAAVAATCTETGLTEGKHCDVCGEVLVAQEVVAALGHTEVIDAAVAPTCAETGLTEGKHCDVCGEVIVAQEEVAALGHTEVVDVAVAADCTNTGLTEGKHCSVCGEVIVAQEVVAALGHDYEVTYYWAGIDNETSVLTYAVRSSGVSCIATGICQIANCGHEEYAEAIINSEITTIPTYTTEGVTTYSATFNNIKWATPQVEKTATVVATVNGKNYTKLNEALEVAKDTQEVVVLNTDVSGEVPIEVGTSIYNDDFEVDLIGCQCSKAVTDAETGITTIVSFHAESMTVKEREVPATCTQAGSYESVEYCGICRAELSRITVIVDAHGHDYHGVVTSPTYKDNGFTTYTCSYCGDVYIDDIVPSGYEPGDANHDGVVDSTDAVLILRNLAGYEVEDFYEETADINCDGKADSSDAVAILRKLAGIT